MGEESNCWSCGRPLDPADRYCRQCGQGQGEYVAWYYHPLGIAFLTLCCVGPFSLYLVWKSPLLSARGRSVAAALILAFTAYLVFAFVAAFRMFSALFAGAL